MDKLRLHFTKTGRAAYISHLDLMRTMQRAFLRAELPLKYSEGFNPHALISMLLPLSLGHESLCELMDFRVYADCDLTKLPTQLNAVLPEGIRAQEAYEPEHKGRELKWLRFQGDFQYDRPLGPDAAERIEAFFRQESIVITRRTKKGEGESDIRGAIQSISAAPEAGGIRLEGVISAQEPTLNPEHLSAALHQLAPELAPDFTRFTRLEVYHSDMGVFR